MLDNGAGLFDGHTVCSTLNLQGGDVDRVPWSGCSQQLLVDGVPISRATSGDLSARDLDAASRLAALSVDRGRVADYCWTRAPDDLTRLYPASYWPFDTGGFSWLYMQFAMQNPGSIDESRDYPIRAQAQQFLESGRPSFIVSALKPYAVYEILEMSTLSEDPDWLSLRIRFYVGLLHHFSFYLPNRGGTYTYTVHDLPENYWSGGRSAVAEIGERSAAWICASAGLSCTVQAEEGSQSSKLYPNYAAAGITYLDYKNSDGTPTVLCFSDEDAFDAGGMTALLGGVLWGEVCCIQPLHSADVDRMIEDGFVHLFGSRVSLTYENRWFDPDTVLRTAERHHCVSAADLRTVGWLVDTTRALRASDPGKWVFRAFDANRLNDVTEAAEAVATPCSCS